MSESLTSGGIQHISSSSTLAASSTEFSCLVHTSKQCSTKINFTTNIAPDNLILCQHCASRPAFTSSVHFKEHLRFQHCKIEGGSFVCLYGSNAVCATLPLEGVSDTDYDRHVDRQHCGTGSFPTMSGDCGGRGDATHSEEKWGIFSPVQNLPSVLNNPKKGMTRDFFTRTWGEGFVEVRSIPPHVALPQVLPRHVEGYSRKMRKRSRLQQRLQQQDQQRRGQSEGNTWTHSVQAGPLSRSDSTSSIPAIFFSPNFNLEDPATFYSVFSHLAHPQQQHQIQEDATGCIMEQADGAKKIQEKLLQHLEAVEGRMCNHIASKSSAFFQSMSHLSVHMEQLRRNQLAVAQLREGITRLHREAVVMPATLLALPRRRQNILRTQRILEVMSVVREVQGSIRVMLGRREFITSLDLITTASQLLQSDLTTIRSFRNVSGELSEQVRIIEKMVCSDFTKYVTEDLNRPLEDDTPLLEEVWIVTDDDQLIAVVFGVLRLNKMDFLDNLKEEIYAAMNATVKQIVAESVSSSSSSSAVVDDNSGGAGEQARGLHLHEWLELLQRLTTCLHHLLRRYKAIVGVMIQAVEASAGRRQPMAEGVQAATIVNMSGCGVVGDAWCSRAVTGLQEGLCQACDYAHDRCAKLLHARSRNNGLAKMTVKEFLTLSGIIEAFVTATEGVSGKKSAPFRMGLQGQCVVFVQRFHSDREGRLRANLGSERWRAVPAPADLQSICNNIDSTGLLVSRSAVPAITTNGVAAADDDGCHDDRTLSGRLAGVLLPPSSDGVSGSGSRRGVSGSTSNLSSVSEEETSVRNDSCKSGVGDSNSGNSVNNSVAVVDSDRFGDNSDNRTEASVSQSRLAPPYENKSHHQKQQQELCKGVTRGLHISASAPNLATDIHAGVPSTGGVVLGGQEYVVVGVGVVVVRLVVEYAECASTLQVAAQSLLTGLADLLRRFNSDTCRLLLEAGAVSLGGLRTISTRHLALAHRCLHLLLALLPPLQQHFASLVKPVIVEKTVGQLAREFSEHCSALETKIISVVGDQLDRLLGGWEARSPVPSPAITGILKACTRLHEAINGVLTHAQVCSVFSRLTTCLRDKLRVHVARLRVMPVGPQSWVVTSELTFYFNHLVSLKVDPQCTQEQFSKQLWAVESS